MRIFFNGLMLGLVLGVGLGWLAHRHWNRPPASAEEERFREQATRAMDAAGEVVFRAGEALRAKAEALNLRPEEIREELARTGRVVRRQARELMNQTPSAQADQRVLEEVRKRLSEDETLSALELGVTVSGGHVTLEGKADSEEHIAEAIVLALSVEGVRGVTSNIQIEPAGNQG